MEVHVHGILGVHKVALIEHGDEVVAVGSIQLWIINDELVIAWLQEGCGRVPVFHFDSLRRQLGSINNADIFQLVA